MGIDQILEIVERYKLRIPPTVFYELKAEIINFEEPTTKNDLGVDCISRKAVLELLEDTNNGWIINEVLQLPSVTPQEPTDNDVVLTYDMYHDLIADRAEKLEQELILDKIRAEIEQTVSRYSISRERGGMGQVEWSDRLIKESEVLEILDKYKAEKRQQDED